MSHPDSSLIVVQSQGASSDVNQHHTLNLGTKEVRIRGDRQEPATNQGREKARE